MWIKQTKVKSKNTAYVYYQLMKTVYLDGKSHQLVVANLGRKGEVEEALVYRLAEVITDEPYLFLPDDLLALLPTKRHGETFLLNKAFEITSLRRFLEDLAEFKCLGADSVSALLLLLAYYSFQQGFPLIRDFFKKYYIRIEGDLKTTSYADAFRLLRGTPQVHPGIISNYNKLKNSRQLKCHYLFDVQADPSLVDGGSLCVDVMTDEYGFPLFYRREPHSARPMSVAAETLYIYQSFHPSLSLAPSSTRYISRITAKQLSALANADPELQHALRACDYSRRYGEDIVYSSIDRGEYRIIALQPYPTGSPAFPPRELLITNLSCEPPDILNWYFRIDTIQDTFYRIFLPKDLAFIQEQFSSSDIVDILLNIHFLRLFMETQLSTKLEPLNISVRDAYDICRNMRIVTLKYGNQKQLLHSIYSPMEIKVLDLLAFN